MYKLVSNIRALVGKRRTAKALIKNRDLWHQLCSSMDVIGDTDLAIGAYLANEHFDDDGSKYLRLYGVLQALFVQQDAVKHLCESLCLSNKYFEDETLKTIREIRNASVGHPTKMKWPNKSFHFISRITISKIGYQLMSYHSDMDEPIFETVSIIELIEKQTKCLSDILRKTIESLEGKDKKHKEKYIMEKLAFLFKGVGYCVEKISEAINRNHPKEIALGLVNELTGVLESFKQSLAKRGEPVDAEYD